MTEERKTARQRYDAKRRAQANQLPSLLARCKELEDSITYVYTENEELKIRIVSLEDENVALKAKVSELEARITALENR